MALVIALVVATFLVYFNAIHHPFVHDDVVFILQNPQIAHLDHLKDVFFPSHQLPAGGILNSYYRPVLEVFNRLQYSVFGFDAAGFHFVNVLVHAINGLILFAILCRLNFSTILSFCVSLLFLIHPLQTEAVDCVSGISNLLSAVFILWTIHSYIVHRYLLAVLILVVALLTKEQSVILLPLIVLVDFYQGKKHKYFLWFLFAFLTIAFLGFRTMMTGSSLIHEILASPSELKLRILSIPQTLLMDLRLIIAPYDLHYYRNTDILADPKGSFCILTALIAGSSFVIYKLSKIRAVILFGIAWFLISLLPVLNIVPLVNEYSFIFTAEHFLYLPMIGIVLSLAVILKEIISLDKLKLLVVLICLSCSGLTLLQNTYWKDEVALFERMITFEPNFARGHILLAKAYSEKQEVDKAIIHYFIALDIMKGYQVKASNDQSNALYKSFVKEITLEIANCYYHKGRQDLAIRYYREALSLQPTNISILKAIGEILMQKSDFQGALNAFEQVLVLDNKSKDFSLLNDMAICYASLLDKSKAEEYFKLSLGLNPAYKPARDNLDKLMKSN